MAQIDHPSASSDSGQSPTATASTSTAETARGGEAAPSPRFPPWRPALATLWGRQGWALRRAAPTALELLALTLWSVVVAYPLLDLNPNVIPGGAEFLSAVQSHHIWTLAAQCGACVMWNGGVRGGAPAFVDVYGSMLHPLVILFTLGWGVVNGAKLTMAAALLLGGLAQLWLGAVLGLGRLARLWAACMAVAAGHLAGRAEIGTFSLVLSTAACSLVLPPLIATARTGERRTAVLLGLAAGQAVLAGQGYMQVALALTLPLALVLVPWQREQFVQRARLGLLAAAIALLLAAPLLVPLLHFLPQFVKDSDPGFTSGQPFTFVPLNLVIDDPEFYRTTVLQKLPYPYLYVNYVGWIAIALAVWGAFRELQIGRRRETIFLGSVALLSMWLASGRPFALVAAGAPESVAEQLAGLRYFPVIAGLAVPPVLALAGLGLDQLLRAGAPRLLLGFSTRERSRSIAPDVRWALLLPLLVALQGAWAFGRNWLVTQPALAEVPVVLDALSTPNLQWVSPPFGEHFYVTPGVERGLKLALGIRPWNWRGRPTPPPLLEAYRQNPPPELTQMAVAGGVPIYRGPPEREYARVIHADGSFTPCAASGAGGDLNVSCEADRPGRLVVYENMWSGWRATVDGQPAQPLGDTWIELDLPAGAQSIALRYRPWDVPLGLVLCLGGVALAGVSLQPSALHKVGSIT